MIWLCIGIGVICVFDVVWVLSYPTGFSFKEAWETIKRWKKYGLKDKNDTIDYWN